MNKLLSFPERVPTPTHRTCLSLSLVSSFSISDILASSFFNAFSIICAFSSAEIVVSWAILYCSWSSSFESFACPNLEIQEKNP